MRVNYGRAELTLEQHPHHHTVICHQYSQAPLQWLGPLSSVRSNTLYYLRNPNGGLLQGDQHQVTVELKAGAHLEIRSQGATRIHPGSTQQISHITLHPHSSLIWIPHPLIPGEHSCFHQQVTVEMDSTARLAYGDIWTAGRIGMGECWRFQQVTNEFQVWILGDSTAPLVWERQDFRSPHTQLSSEGVLGSWTCWGSLYLIGDWDPVPWPLSATQWSVPLQDSRCKGQILRQMGHQSMKLWSVFRDTIP